MNLSLKTYLEILYKTAIQFNLSDIHNSHQNCSDFSRAALLFSNDNTLEGFEVQLVVSEVQSNIDYDSKTNQRNSLADNYVKGEWYGHELLIIGGIYHDFTIGQFGYPNGELGASLPSFIKIESLKQSAEKEFKNQFYKYMIAQLAERT